MPAKEAPKEAKSDLIGPRPTSEDAETLRSWANNGYSESARMAENIAEEIEYPEDEQDEVGGEITPLVNKDREGRITTAASLRDNPVSGDLYISYLATNPELLGRGYGTQMLGRIAQIAADRGAGLSLEATPDSLPFWEKMGAKETPEGFLGWDDKQVKKLAEDLQHPKAPVDIDKLHYPAQDFQAKTGEPIKINAYRATMSPDVADIKNVERGSFFAPEAMGDFGDHIYRAVLDFKNPLVADDGTAAAKALGDEKLARQFEDLLSGWDSEKDEPLHMDEHTWEDADKKLTAAAKAAGHDGVIFHGHDDMNPVQYIAVDPDAITKAEKVGKYNQSSGQVEPDEAEEPNEKGTSKLADAAKLYSQGLIDGHKIASVSRAVINGDDVNEAGINAGATDEHIAAAKMLVKAVDDAKPKDVEMYRAVTPSERYGQDLLKVKSGDTVNLDRISSFSTDRSQAAYYGEKGKPNVELKLVGENRTVPTDEMTGMGHQEHLTYGKFRVVDVEGPSSIDLPEAFKGNTKYKRTVILEPAKEEVSTEPPKDRAEYVPLEDTYKFESGHYLGPQGEQIASSRTTPQGPYPWKPGQWRIDSMNGLHGHEIDQLRELPVGDLTPTENPRDYMSGMGTNRGEDVDRYKGWMEEGKEPPPISVVETEGGQLKITNGHRRFFAAKELGRPTVQAWVSPTVDVPGKFDSNGKPIKTGLTYELAHAPEEAPKSEAPAKAEEAQSVVRATKPAPDPVGLHEDDLPYRAKYQSVDFSKPDLQDSVKKVTEKTIKETYAPKTKAGQNASVYQSYIPMEDMPSPRFVSDEEENFDRGDYSMRSGIGSPVKVLVKKNGTMQILDGNHRTRVWEEQNQEYAPAWVIDERHPHIEQLSEDERAERQEADEEFEKELGYKPAFHDRLIQKINNRDWWHVPPVEGEAAYAKRGKFLAPTYRDAEFYGRPLNDAQKVNITNPIVGPEKEIAKKLGLDPQREGMSQKELNAHDRAWALAAKKAGYDAIVTVGEKQWKKFKETGRIPADMEVNDLKELKE